MRLFENIALAMSSLRAGKMRALLTMLGIIIGIGSVIAIVTVGNSLMLSITDSMDEMGANQVQAYVTTRERNVSRDMTDDDYITMDMINEFREKYADEIKSVVMWQQCGSGQAKDGRRYANVYIYGGPAECVDNNGAVIVRGRDITDQDVEQNKNVAIISNVFSDRMFKQGENPIGKEIQIRTDTYGILTFTVVGVYKFKPPMFNVGGYVPEEDMETELNIPITTAKRIAGANDGFRNFSARLQPGVDSYQVQQEMEDFFNEKYRNNLYFTVFTQNMESMVSQMTTMLGTLAIAIAIIAAISLLVGGIGVMNIMLVSVTERTREIGTRKALWARSSAIRSQFIIESMIICLIGGMIGVLVGLGLGALGSGLLGFPAQPSLPIIIIAVVFSMVIGVFFGFYPANKASKLDPIEALRYE